MQHERGYLTYGQGLKISQGKEKHIKNHLEKDVFPNLLAIKRPEQG